MNGFAGSPLDLAALDADRAAFDTAVARSLGVDPFCSSSDWILPAAETLMPAREPYVYRCDSGFIALMRGHHPRGFRYLEALEASWGLASPLVGPDARVLAEALADLLQHARGEFELLVLSGIIRGSALESEVKRALERARFMAVPHSTTTRHLADLAGGLEGFLARRSRYFRRNVERARRKADEVGVELESLAVGNATDADRLFDRVVAVESASWKGQSGMGIDHGEWGRFYRLIVRRLAARGAQRAVIARLRGRDVAYVLGGVLGRRYRGLQMSFDETSRELSLGTLCQIQQIADLAAEGVETYDLGTGLEYKRHWAEVTEDSEVLFVVPG